MPGLATPVRRTLPLVFALLALLASRPHAHAHERTRKRKS